MHNRYLALAISIWIFALGAKAQAFKKNDAFIGGHYQSQLMQRSSYFDNVYGISASYFVADRISLEYSLSYIISNDGPNYGRLYGGSVLAGYGVGLASRSIDTEGLWTLAILSLLVPEGVSYHLPINHQVTLSPYTNLLSVDIASDFWRMSNALGLRINMVAKNKIVIAPDAFGIIQYRGRGAGGSVVGFGFGLRAGLKF